MLARSPNRKRAEQYLAASGAVPISVVTTELRDGVCSISTGKIAGQSAARTADPASRDADTGTVAARWWIAERDAAPVAALARRFAGVAPDLPAATTALRRRDPHAG